MNPEMLDMYFEFALKLLAIILTPAVAYYISSNQRNAAKVQKVNEYLKIAKAAVQAAEDVGMDLSGGNKLLKAIKIFEKETSGKTDSETASAYVRAAYRDIEDNGGFKTKKNKPAK